MYIDKLPKSSFRSLITDREITYFYHFAFICDDHNVILCFTGYAEHNLEMDQSTFTRGWLEKMSSAKKTVKRLNKFASESEKQ